MKGTFEFKLKDGRTCTIEATYECTMKNEILDADGYMVVGQPRPANTLQCNMIAYVNGEKFDSSRDPNFWRLIDVPGAKKIWGLKVGFASQEDAKRYEEWLAELIDGGKSDEVKAYEKIKNEKEINNIIEVAKETIKKAESQKDIPAKEEAKRRMNQYNDIVNEGGEGYVPYIVSAEEYEYAKGVVEKYGN